MGNAEYNWAGDLYARGNSSIKRVYDKVFAKIREGWDEEKSDAK